jgi:hypothetical protein
MGDTKGHKHLGDHISLPYFYQSKESRLSVKKLAFYIITGHEYYHFSWIKFRFVLALIFLFVDLAGYHEVSGG